MGLTWIYVILVAMVMVELSSGKACSSMEYIGLTSPDGRVPVPQAIMDDVMSCVTWCSDVTSCQAVTYNKHSGTCSVFDTLPKVTITNPCCQLYRKRAIPCHNGTDSDRGAERSTAPQRGTGKEIVYKRGTNNTSGRGIETDRATDTNPDKGTDSNSDSKTHKGLTPIELGRDFGDSNVLSLSAEVRLDDQVRGALLKVNFSSRSDSALTGDESRSNSSHSREDSRSAESPATLGSANSTEAVSRSLDGLVTLAKAHVTVNSTGSNSSTTFPNLNKIPLAAENELAPGFPKVRDKSDLLKEEDHGSWSFNEDEILTSEEISQQELKVETHEPFEDFNHTNSHEETFSQDITQQEMRKVDVQDVFSQDLTQPEIQKMVLGSNPDLEDLDMVTSVTIDLDLDSDLNELTSVSPKANLTQSVDSVSVLAAITKAPSIIETVPLRADNSSNMATIVVEVGKDMVDPGLMSGGEGVTPAREDSAETIIAEPSCKQNVTIMQPQGSKNQPGGADIGRAVTSQQCQDWCLENHYCVSVDYNLWDRSCWWHGMPGHTRNSTCCTHHVKLHTCTYDCFDIYHGYMLNSTSDSSLNVTLEECRALCTQEENCTGFDYCNLTSSCRLILEVISTTISMRVERNTSLYAIKKDCYGSPQDIHIILATTTILPSFPDFTFPNLPSTSPSDVDDADASTTDAHFLLSPAALIVLGGCSLVLTVGGATMVGYLLHRRREKRLHRGDLPPHHHPAVWMNDYPAAHYATRGLSYWYADGPPGVMAVNPAFNQHDEFPVGRTSAEFGMGRGLAEDSSSRRQRTLSGGVSRSRSFGDSPYGIQHPSYPTFPLRQLRVSVPSTSGGSAPSPGNSPTTPSTHAHAHYPGSYGEYHMGGHIDGRRLPRYELGMLHDDELRCAYP